MSPRRNFLLSCYSQGLLPGSKKFTGIVPLPSCVGNEIAAAEFQLDHIFPMVGIYPSLHRTAPKAAPTAATTTSPLACNGV